MNDLGLTRSGLAWFILGAGTVLVLAFLIFGYPLLAAAIFGAVCLSLATWYVPQTVLSAILIFTLTGGPTYGDITIIANMALALAGFLSFLFLIGESRAHSLLRVLALALAPLIVMSIRYSFERDFDSVLTLLLPITTIFLTCHSLIKSRNTKQAVAIGGILFIFISAIFGEYNHLDIRYMGISGNPNRMSFGILLFIPFILWGCFNAKNLAVKTITLLSLTLAIGLLFLSQSTQALVGLLVISAGLVTLFAIKRGILTKYLISVGLIGLVMFVFLQVLPELQYDDNWMTLSGRTPLYEVAWNEFLREPLYGTGQTHVSEGMILDRSAHSSLLGFLAYGGLLAGLPWLIILYCLLKNGTARLRRGDVLGLGPLILIVAQSVQAVEYIPLTWFVVTFCIYSLNNRYAHQEYERPQTRLEC